MAALCPRFPRRWDYGMCALARAAAGETRAVHAITFNTRTLAATGAVEILFSFVGLVGDR